ncbi:DMT family transporter [uncultured Sphingomonas sp.]|uniref:DMT family transporter n=1 Tax=uncultured Sphingomonas sp. TaxID=158754 RepID=UPI0025FD02D1|nr:DMT family transporter [uncultured Sphingomonas sp.]
MDTTRSGDRPGLVLGALFLANVALACGPWLVRLAQADGGVGPVSSGFWRLTLALPILLLATRTERRNSAVPPWGMLGTALLSGLFFAADLGMWHAGILHTRLANATLLGNITAILFPLYGFIAARMLPTRRQGLALSLAALGAMLLLGRSYELSARNLVGDLLCVAAGICYTAYLIAADRARAGLGPVSTLACAAAAGSPALLVTALAMGESVWPRDWTALILMTLGSQIVGQGLIMYAVSRAAPVMVGLMLLLQPIVAATIGWVVYGEALTPFDMVGAVAVAAAVLLVRGARRLPPKEKPLSLEP